MIEIIDHEKEQPAEQLTQEEMDEYVKKHCPTCETEIIEIEAAECRRNAKILNFLQAEDAQPLVQGALESIPCPKHPMKIIDYFCKTCS